MPVTIIGLGRQRSAIDFQQILEGSAIFARDGEVADAWLRNTPWDFTDLSGFLDGPTITDAPARVVEAVADALHSSRHVSYLTPGAGNIGDVITVHLCQSFDCDVIPGSLPAPLGMGNCQVVDALSLAIAEEAIPFDAGLERIDTTRATVVTNLRGRGVRTLALDRLGRSHSRPPVHLSLGTAIYDADPDFRATTSLPSLEQIVAKLRSPEGCPWDREQTITSLLPQLEEELAEFKDAWDGQDAGEQADELGDVLLHILMIAQIAHEGRRFDIQDVVRAISGKMVRRHPHVFGDAQIESMDELYALWDDIKASERADSE